MREWFCRRLLNGFVRVEFRQESFGFGVIFFNKSQNTIEQHGDDAKDHDRHEYPGKLKEAGMHSERE